MAHLMLIQAIQQQRSQPHDQEIGPNKQSHTQTYMHKLSRWKNMIEYS